MPTQLPPVPSLRTIRSRIIEVFPEGTENRTYVVREIAVSSVFVMFYTGAIEGADTWIRPDQVTKMSDAQAAKTDDTSRTRWTRDSLAPGKMKAVRGRWYASNTREPIRDETLRMGLVLLGAVVERPGLPTTSARPRYALKSEFAALFDQRLSRDQFRKAVRSWQENFLSATALARIRLRRRGALAAGSGAHVLVTLPNGESRQMAPGPSSLLSKEVPETFAPRFLAEPAVVFLSESGNTVVSNDQRLAHDLGLRIEPDRNLPDIILQSMFIQGQVDNTQPGHIETWIRLVGEIRPLSVQVYTIDRAPADSRAHEVPLARLQETAARLSKRTGIPAEVYD